MWRARSTAKVLLELPSQGQSRRRTLASRATLELSLPHSNSLTKDCKERTSSTLTIPFKKPMRSYGHRGAPRNRSLELLYGNIKTWAILIKNTNNCKQSLTIFFNHRIVSDGNRAGSPEARTAQGAEAGTRTSSCDSYQYHSSQSQS